MLTKEFMKQDVSHFLPVSHPSHFGSGKKEEKQDTSFFMSEEYASEYGRQMTVRKYWVF